jgi:hypothetical protein
MFSIHHPLAQPTICRLGWPEPAFSPYERILPGGPNPVSGFTPLNRSQSQVIFNRTETNPNSGHLAPVNYSSRNTKQLQPRLQAQPGPQHIVNRKADLSFLLSDSICTTKCISTQLPITPPGVHNCKIPNRASPISGHFFHKPQTFTKKRCQPATMESSLPPLSAEDCLEYVR